MYQTKHKFETLTHISMAGRLQSFCDSHLSTAGDESLNWSFIQVGYKIKSSCQILKINFFHVPFQCVLE